MWAVEHSNSRRALKTLWRRIIRWACTDFWPVDCCAPRYTSCLPLCCEIHDNICISSVYISSLRCLTLLSQSFWTLKVCWHSSSQNPILNFLQKQLDHCGTATKNQPPQSYFWIHLRRNMEADGPSPCNQTTSGRADESDCEAKAVWICITSCRRTSLNFVICAGR